MDRRRFAYLAAGVSASATISYAQDVANPLRVAVIGHTGRGDYGHGLDTVWVRLDETKIVAVADPVESGRSKELAKLKLDAAAGFADYREMLDRVKPDIVAICPRHADQRRDMIVAAVEAGAKGIYVEKPFVRTPAEADQILAACGTHNAKLAVAHRNRYHPVLQTLDRLIAEGRIGKLLEIRGRGKGDRRGGTEDFMGAWLARPKSDGILRWEAENLLGSHAQDGRRVTKADVRDGAEGLGLLAGNELHARYEFDGGNIGYFDSIANDGTKNAGFGLQLIGSDGIINIQADKTPLAHLCPGNPFAPTAKPRRWLPISTAGVDKPEPRDDLQEMVHQHGSPARDLVAAVRGDHQPLCNADEEALTVEMICAVFESHRQQSRAIELPTAHRGNALANL